MNIVLNTILVGMGATVTMDIYAIVLKLLGIKTLDYRYVGRWIGHFPKGEFSHTRIMDATAIPYEHTIGWIAHYFIGIAFSALLVLIYGENWLNEPTLLPALITGLVTVAAPFFLMQPAFGFGIAASKLPNPGRARVMSLITHSIYGLGLYCSALLLNQLIGM
jgi:hypothetical protein